MLQLKIPSLNEKVLNIITSDLLLFLGAEAGTQIFIVHFRNV